MTGSQLHQLTAGLAGVESGTGLDGVPFCRPTLDSVRRLGDATHRWLSLFTQALAVHLLAQAGNYNVGPDTCAHVALTSGGAVAINLPVVGPGGEGRFLMFKRQGANAVTINAQAGQLIDGAASLVLASDGAAVILVSGYLATVFGWSIFSSS